MNENRFLWVDPPSGWKYGFPKIWDKEKYPSVVDFFKANNVPKEIINLDRFRFWIPEEQEIRKMQENEKA